MYAAAACHTVRSRPRVHTVTCYQACDVCALPGVLARVNAVKLCKQRVTDHGEERVVRQVEEEAFAALHEHVMRIVHHAPELLDGRPSLVVEFKGIPQRVAIVCSAPTHCKPVCRC